MFGGRKSLAVEGVEDASDYDQAYEYKTLAVMGAVAFDKELNAEARRGWELVNGCMAGAVHYGYLRRAVRAE